MRDSFENDGRRTALQRSKFDLRDDADEAPASASRLATVGWGFLGFIVGAAFWHFIGFWGFVSDVVLKGHPNDERVIAQTGHDCVELAIDRKTGAVTSVACPLFAPELAEGRRAFREDSARLAQNKIEDTPRWSILISQEEDAEVQQPPSPTRSADADSP